jgi:SAM-dependent methyltransferase
MASVAYKFWREAWFEYDGLLDWLCHRSDVRRVCEVGAGANPALQLDFLSACGIDHAIVDISQEELDKAPVGYTKLLLDMTQPLPQLTESVDLVASSFVAEHVHDPVTFHRNVWRMLRPGGFALHVFPTFYALPFLLNRAVPERVTDRVLIRFQRFREPEGHEGKFPAYYHWCRGPTQRQIARFRDVGFELLSFRGYFGHGYYLHFGLLNDCENAKAKFLLRHPVPQLTPYGLVLLRRPAIPGSQAIDDIPERPQSRTVVSFSTRHRLNAGYD